MQLIITYELYTSGSYDESLLEIESVVQYIERCKSNMINEQCLNAYNHIARATYAYITLTLNLDSKMVNLNFFILKKIIKFFVYLLICAFIKVLNSESINVFNAL